LEPVVKSTHLEAGEKRKKTGRGKNRLGEKIFWESVKEPVTGGTGPKKRGGDKGKPHRPLKIFLREIEQGSKACGYLFSNFLLKG